MITFLWTSDGVLYMFVAACYATQVLFTLVALYISLYHIIPRHVLLSISLFVPFVYALIGVEGCKGECCNVSLYLVSHS